MPGSPSQPAFSRTLIALVGVVILLLPTGSALGESPVAVIGYLPGYRIGSVSAEQASALSHLIYFGIEAPADGKLPDPPLARATFEKLQKLKRSSKCKLLICVGGWGRSDGFPALAKSPDARKRFVAGMRTFCKENGFDGIDYDWEHPEGAAQLADYASLLGETAETFRPAGLSVTVAQAAWQDLGKEAYRALDRVHLMSYDHDFPQATFEKSCADVEKLVAWGCPPGKIALGLPFYGRNKTRQSKTYGELVAGEPVDRAVDVIDGYAFNGQKTIAKKLAFAKDRGLAGVMIWELGQDSGEPGTSLLRLISRAIKTAP